MQTIDQAAQAATNALVLLVQRRQHAQTEDEFNAITVQILEGLASLGYPKRSLEKPPIPQYAQIVEKVVSDIHSGNFALPFKFETVSGEPLLFIRIADMTKHLAQCKWLVDNCQSIRSNIGLKRVMHWARVLVADDSNTVPAHFERTIGGKRVGHLVAIRLADFRSVGWGLIAAPTAADHVSKP